MVFYLHHLALRFGFFGIVLRFEYAINLRTNESHRTPFKMSETNTKIQRHIIRTELMDLFQARVTFLLVKLKSMKYKDYHLSVKDCHASRIT